ncbi:MAG: 5-oxoprolinase subunit PxpA, partial [Alphaproteobacteria bacterium]
MELTIDLNADMGEGFGRWEMGDDEALLDIVTSANIACGMHAGDWDTMARTMCLATKRGVGIGAHPGFADLQGFGRRRIDMSPDSAASLVAYQVGAARGIARCCGTDIRHVKLHGALANMAADDESLARTCFEAALKAAPDAIIMVIAATAQARAVEAIGCAAAFEIFADRAYAEDGSLMDRRLPGAVIDDADAAAERVLEMLRKGAIITVK